MAEVLAGGVLRQKKARFTEEDAKLLLFGGPASNRNNLPNGIVHNRLHRLWFLCLAFYAGHQSRADIDAVATMTDWMEPTQEELMYVANHIAPLVARQVSRMLASKGNFQAIPATSDFRDQRGARAASHLLNYWHDYLNVRDLRRALAMWMVITGTGFLYADWDEDAGQERRIYRNPFAEGEFLESDELTPQQIALMEEYELGEDVNEGDMTAAAISPFEVSFPTSYDSLESMPWVRIDRVRSFEWLYDHYGKKADEVRPETLAAPTQVNFFRRLMGLVQGSAVSAANQQDMDNAVVVTEFWRPPCKLMPRGARLVGAGGVLLANDAHPSVERELDIRFPISRARFLPIPGTFLGMGMVQQLLDPQVEYNRARTQVIQQRDILSHPQWMASRKPTWMRTEYGDFWLHDENHQPTLVQPPALSQMHVETKGAAIYDFQVLSAQSEASQGQNPAGVRSGNALMALQERDLETIGIAFEEMEGALEQHANIMLQTSAKMLTMPRAVTLTGKAFMADVIYLKGSDLRGNTRVILERGSTRPQSEAALVENVTLLLQTGILMPAMNPDHARFVNKVFKFRDLEAATLLEDLQERRAEQENELFANPQIDPVTGARAMWPDTQKFDDDVIHIRTHTKFQLTDEWESWPADQKMAHMAHVYKHEQKLAQMAMLQQTMAGPPQGSQPKQLGQPSQPKATKEPANP